MAARHKKRASGAPVDKDRSFVEKDKAGDDKPILKEAKMPFKPADSEDKIHGKTVKSRFMRPGRKSGGACGADNTPISSAGKGLATEGWARGGKVDAGSPISDAGRGLPTETFAKGGKTSGKK